MPVEDHDVHESTQHDKPPSGCYNRTGMKNAYFMLQRYYNPDGSYELGGVWVMHNMSKTCRQVNDLPECVGCVAGKDTDYIRRMKSLMG